MESEGSMFIPSGVMHHWKRLRMSHTSPRSVRQRGKYLVRPAETSARSRPPRNLLAPRSSVWQSAHEWLRSPTRFSKLAFPRAIAARASALDVSTLTGRPFDARLTSIVKRRFSVDSPGSGRPVVSGAWTARKSSTLITRPYALTNFGYRVATPRIARATPPSWQSAHAFAIGPGAVHSASAPSVRSTAGLLVGSRLSPNPTGFRRVNGLRSGSFSGGTGPLSVWR